MQQQEATPDERQADAAGDDHGHREPSVAEQRRRAAARNWLSIALGAFVVILGTITGAAWAFGGNTPPNDQAGARGVTFSHVIASATVSPAGGTFLSGSADGLHVQLTVPTVAVPTTEHVILSAGNPASVSLAGFHDVPSRYRRYHAVAVLGASFRAGNREMLQHRLVTLTLSGSKIAPGDVVMLYARHDHVFQAATGGAEIRNGQAEIRLRTSTDLAVLAP